MPALRLTGKAFAYLKIAEGCVHRCSYCAIPSIRGKYRSRPMSAILREARALIKTGCRELNVVAQDPMLWAEKGKRRWRKEVEVDIGRFTFLIFYGRWIESKGISGCGCCTAIQAKSRKIS